MPEEQHNSNPLFDIADEYRPEPPPAPEIPAWRDGSIRVGIHTSIAGDIAQSLEIAHALGANALQIFSSSPRMWARPQRGTRIAPADAERFRSRRRALGLGPVVIHDNYLINLASPEPMLRVRSIQAFHDEIVRAVDLGADYLVMHPGSGRGTPAPQAIARIAESLRQAARGLKLNDLCILLENTAGQGSCVGARFAELQAILDACADLPMGVCVDTAHLFEAGHDLRSHAGLEKALEEIQSTVGLDRVHVLHVNDSRTPLGSHADRHENIGKGKIGLEGFRRLLNHPLLAGRPLILETPIDKPGDDRRNVLVLWKLLGVKVKVSRRAQNGFPEKTNRLRAKTKKRRLRPVARRRRGIGKISQKRKGRSKRA